MTTTEEDVTAGITARTTKAEYSARLHTAAGIIKRLRKQGGEEKRTKQIEKRVREKWATVKNDEILQVIVQGTEAELRAAAAFIADFEDVAPATLQRLRVGAETLLGERS